MPHSRPKDNLFVSTPTLQSDVFPQYEGLGEKGEMEDKLRPPSFHNFQQQQRQTNLTLGPETHQKLSGSILSPNIWRNQVHKNQELDSSQRADPEWAETYWFFSPFCLRYLNLKWKWNCNFY